MRAVSPERQKKARRGRGEGAVYQRADGYWCGVHQIDYKRRKVYGKTKAEVLAKLDRIRHSNDRQEYEKLTLGVYLDDWLSKVVEGAVRDSTHALYSSIVKTHLKPRLGSMRVRNITSDHISKMLSDMERAGASPRVRQMALSVLSNALRKAKRQKIVSTNECEDVARPRGRRNEIHVLNDEQIIALLEAARGDRLYPLYALALSTGMRVGELLGLQWVDVDDELRVIHVRRQLVRRPITDDSRSTELADPKTSLGRRRIELSETVVKTLMAHKDRMGDEGHADLRSHVFCTAAGKPLHYNNLINRSFLPLLEKAKLPRMRFHNLRHTHASQLLRTGEHIKVVSERLGHSSAAFTLVVYSHLLPSMQREAANHINAVFDEDTLQLRSSEIEKKNSAKIKKP